MVLTEGERSERENMNTGGPNLASAIRLLLLYAVFWSLEARLGSSKPQRRGIHKGVNTRKPSLGAVLETADRAGEQKKKKGETDTLIMRLGFTPKSV